MEKYNHAHLETTLGSFPPRERQRRCIPPVSPRSYRLCRMRKLSVVTASLLSHGHQSMDDSTRRTRVVTAALLLSRRTCHATSSGERGGRHIGRTSSSDSWWPHMGDETEHSVTFDEGWGGVVEEEERERIAGSALEVEILPVSEAQLHEGTARTSPGSTRSGDAATPSASPSPEGDTDGEVVKTLDTFARAAVTNFISRVTGQKTAARRSSAPSNGTSSPLSTSSAAGAPSPEPGRYDVVIREVEGSGAAASGASGCLHFHARQRLPLPDAYGERYAEGFGATEKEAETLAAMHAVRTLDALGIPVYQLSSKQKKHAEAARAAGRHAPLPGEGPMPPGTPTPPVLRYHAEGAVAAMERRLHVDKMHFAPVTADGAVSAFTPFPLTLASPYFLDPGSVHRIKAFFTAYKADIQRYSKVVALHKDDTSMGGGHRGPHPHHATTARGADRRQDACLFLAQLRLPIMPRFGDRVCMGKAATRKDAITLACMHAELTIDALGLALYPGDGDKQRAHVEECRRVGRWCATPGDVDYRYDTPTPPPLQLVSGSAEERATRHVGGHASGGPSSITAEVERGATTMESTLVRHSRAVKEMHQVLDVEQLDESARPLLQHYLEHTAHPPHAKATSGETQAPPFLVEVLGIKFHETYRATITVPLRFAPHNDLTPSDQAGRSTHHHREESFVAIGISSESGADAELAAATHALRVLSALNHPIAFHEEAAGLLRSFVGSGSVAGQGGVPLYDPHRPSLEPRQLTGATGMQAALLLPIRCVSPTHLGRILSPGLAGNTEGRGHQTNRRGRLLPPSLNTQLLHGGNERAGSPATAPVRLQEGEIPRAIEENRRKLPKQDWSLAEDADHRILVDPAATAAGGHNYVHTLSAVRTPDVFAVNRLKDYLERHGKRLEACVEHRVVDVAEGAAADEGTATTAHHAPTQEESAVGPVGSLAGDKASKRLARALGRATAVTTLAPQLHLHVATCVLPTRLRGMAAMAAPGTEGEDHAMAAPSGRVVAHGEAYSAEEAVLMCAMHAELLLDALGIVLYDHPDLQRRHADTARMLGRWAPMARGAVPPVLREDGCVTPIPPPLRKEHQNSCLWSRVALARARERGATAPHATPRETSPSMCPAPHEKDGGQKIRLPEEASSATMTMTTTNSGNAGHMHDTANQEVASSASLPSARVDDDDQLCDVALLQPVHHSEIFRFALRHMQVYFLSRGSDFYRSVRQYTVPSPQYGRVHRAIAELPVPTGFGRRFAVGCASSKKRALSLCATHAAWTLEALSIPIYTGKRQAEYAKAAALRGRSAPRPGDPMKPFDTPSPKGLCCFVDGAVERPEAPRSPTDAELRENPRGWPIYVGLCRTFIEKNREADLQEALFELRQAPRSGIDVEDDALDVVERAPLNTYAKHALTAACARAGLPTPPLPFRYEAHGRPPKRMFLTEAPVLGTPYVARGVGKNPSESLARAAMQYEYLVTHVASRNTTVNSPASPHAARGSGRGYGGSQAAPSSSIPRGGDGSNMGSGTSHGHVTLYDKTWNTFTVAGQEAAIALYCATNAPFAPLMVKRKTTSTTTTTAEGGEPSSDAVTVVARVDDANGSFTQVSSRACEAPHDAAEDAIKRLFTQLQGRPPFQAIAHLIRRHPQLRLGALACLKRQGLPAEGLQEKKSATDEAAVASPTVQSLVRRAMTSPLPTSANGPRTPDPLNTEACVRAMARVPLRTPASAQDGAFFSSHTAELLLELAERQTGQAPLPAAAESTPGRAAPALTIPAAARDALPLMGLLMRGRKSTGVSASTLPGALVPVVDDGAEAWFVTAAGVAVALLMQCLPPRRTVAEAAPAPTSPFVLSAGPLLPLQLGKLLLAGLLTDSVAAACRMASWVVCGDLDRRVATSEGFISHRGLSDIHQWMSTDVVEAALGELPFPSVASGEKSAVQAYEAALMARLHACEKSVVQHAPDSPLAQLFRHSKPFRACETRRTGEEPPVTQQRQKLRLAVAYATYPQLWVAQPTFADLTGATPPSVSPPARVFDSPDGLRTALIPNAADSVSAGTCFATFDCGVVPHNGGPSGTAHEASRRRTHGHVNLCGTQMHPAASLVATMPGCNETSVLSVDEDASDKVALLFGGTVAAPLRTADAVRAMQTLQHGMSPALEGLVSWDTRGMGDRSPLAEALLLLTEAPSEAIVFHHKTPLQGTEEEELRAYVGKLNASLASNAS